mmetsp:Transcript_18716/g.40523  ORF Transcript_18716/g.40523 Transcript_18716/m.40523 type:complete len:393 (-) Transcript_18716:585-1763(-)
MESLYKSYVAPYASPTAVPVAILVAVVVLTNAYLRYVELTTKSKKKKSTSTNKGTTQTKNIFDTFHRRKKKSNKDNGGGKKAHHTSNSNSSGGGSDKPFGSSYYYAHNDPNRIGGYKDGLRMEDYVMNGPRLLAKGGRKVAEEEKEEEEEGEEKRGADHGDGSTCTAVLEEEVEKDASTCTSNAPSASSSSAATAPVPVRPSALPSNSVPVARYMWDDTAVTSGCSDVGKLYVDTLPNKPSSAPDISWDKAGISKAEVTAQLLGDEGRGLLIRITRTAATGTEPRSYHLYVRRMYGSVAEVKVVVKAKRLLVKLIKKRSRLNLWDKTNLKPWPQLSEKAAGAGGGSDDVGYIDEDLFKRDVRGGIPGMPQAAGTPGARTTLDEKLFGGTDLD